MSLDLNKVRNYAKLIVKNGINIQEGQILWINSSIEAEDFTTMVVEEAYKAGASFVEVRFNSNKCRRARLENVQEGYWDFCPDHIVACFNEANKHNTAYLSIGAPNPDALKGIDSKVISATNKASSLALKDHSKHISNSECSWCVVNVPSNDWAKKIFPELPLQEAYDKLFDLILSSARADSDDVVSAWKKHVIDLKSKVDYLNKSDFQFLNYKSSTTDLQIELPLGAIWQGGSEENSKGVEFIANIPTEEVFTAPLRTGVNGYIKNTKPFNCNGNLIDGFTLHFKDGKVVDFTCEKGYDLLKDLLNTDEGASYLGEVALVPNSSPINKTGVVFYSTLFDENASCHLAIGRCYATNIKNGEKMSEEELLAAGGNVSLIHEDFMIGSSDLDITGVTRDGVEVSIFKNGEWAI